MSLQPAGLNLPNDNAMRALSHMAQAVEASENRVQRSSDEVFGTLRAALEQSENNNRLLTEQNTRLNERVTQLEQTRAQLETAHQAKHQASEEHFRALNARIDGLARQLTEKTNEIETKLDALQKRYNGHTHNYYMTTTGHPIHRWIGTSGPNV